jgi:hypothetical protein
MKTTDLVHGLRAAADWYEQHPEIRLPTDDVFHLINASLPDTKETVAAVAHALGSCEKEYSDTMFRLVKKFGPVRLVFVFWRTTICERRVVRTEWVPEKVTPAYEREIVEWDCGPALEATPTT